MADRHFQLTAVLEYTPHLSTLETATASIQQWAVMDRPDLGVHAVVNNGKRKGVVFRLDESDFPNWLTAIVKRQKKEGGELPNLDALAKLHPARAFDVYVGTKKRGSGEFPLRDAWDMRDALLRLKSTANDCLAFLHYWGGLEVKRPIEDGQIAIFEDRK